MKSIYILVGLRSKMDDVWNYIPSRISALLMIASAWIFRMDYKKGVGSLEKRQAKACQPEFRTDRSGMCRCTSGAACRRCLLFWKIISERDNWR